MSNDAAPSEAHERSTRRVLKRWLRRTGGRALVAAGHALAALVTVVFLSLMSFAIPFAGGLGVAQAAFWTGLLPVELAALTALAVATPVAAWLSLTGERVRRSLATGRAAAMLPAIATLGLAISTFAALNQFLYDRGLLELTGNGISGDTIADAAFEFYFWHLFDAIPVLDITQTLRWEPRYTYADSLSGPLLLTFKAFVILPLIQAGRIIFVGRPHSR